MKQRIITGVVAAALFIPIVWSGGWLFTALVYVLASIGLYELVRMKKLPVLSVPALLAAALLWVILIPGGSFQDSTFTGLHWSKVDITFLVVLLLLSYTVLSKNTFTFDDAAFLLLSTLYVALGFYYLNETRIEGIRNILYALFVIWATDSGAYFIGKAVGKRKLWPEISPNKTVEGSIGGVICAIVVAFIYQLFLPIWDSAAAVVLVTAVVSVCGQLGDLVQSAYKRHYGVKDSGNILPGHGGILDRLDSLIFVLPLLHLLRFF
ncbi:phosphatidate cytidylyltransferase [Ectobacillus ponti]|uniref:Phosphatidate cytidylyltransferase n=1 Tax=Ectobacillus ponti TaxID=2961894 RepID=A0AA42BPR3_9BACI|nr:phosphatidate cytidylyltransferase [Ectobacillus ponti]MCP8969027.1 phosphatidate cytidylyltransferase [Ectobacillus ponti]